MQELSVSTVEAVIEDVLASEGAKSSLGDYEIKRLSREIGEAMNGLNSHGTTTTMTSVPGLPYAFDLGIYTKRTEPSVLQGQIALYLAYSTWDGRCLFLDHLDLPSSMQTPSSPTEDELERSVLQILAKMAVKLDCARLNWKKTELSAWYAKKDQIQPEVLGEWLCLRMDKSAILKYTGENESFDLTGAKPLTRPVVEENIESCLISINEELTKDSKTQNFSYRLAKPQGKDTVDIARLVQGLAIFEKEPDGVNVTEENYRCDGSAQEPLFYCILLEDLEAINKEGSKEAYAFGMAFLYLGYDFKAGRFLYLEDLFLEEAYRKLGMGSRTMQALAQVALFLGCDQFDWVALDWNTPALNLYSKIGAKVQEGVKIVRYTGATLKKFAGEETA